MQMDLISLHPPLWACLPSALVIEGAACAEGQGSSTMADNHVLAPPATLPSPLVHSAVLEATASVPKVSVKRSCWGHTTDDQFSLENP